MIFNFQLKSEIYLLSHIKGRLHMENVHSSSLLSDMAQTSDVMQKYYMQHICDAPEGMDFVITKIYELVFYFILNNYKL